MPHKNKAGGKVSKKGKALKKRSTPTAPCDHVSDWTSGDDEPSVKDMFANMRVMMASLSTRMDEVEGGGRKNRKECRRELRSATRRISEISKQRKS